MPASKWGCQVMNTTGKTLLEICTELVIVLANAGYVSTFRGRGLDSIVDLICLRTSSLKGLVWSDENDTYSDHQAIIFDIGNG